MPLNAHKGGANRQLYIAISPELLIRQKSDLRNEFRPRNELRGWPAITPKQIPHGWRPPSWKSIWRHNNFRSQWSDLDEIRYPAEWHADYAKCSRSKPEIELQQSTFQRFAAQYYHLFLLKMVSEIVAVSDVSLWTLTTVVKLLWKFLSLITW